MVNTRRLDAFLDDLVAGRRPRGFQADAEESEVVRAAIALRAQRPGDAAPQESFIASLHEELSDLSSQVPALNDPRTRWGRSRAKLFGVAAALALIGGTVAITEASTQPTIQSATQVPHGQTLRTATFETAAGRVMGQIVVYQGHPSWVFMEVDAPYASGSMTCELHLANGDVVAAGTVQVQGGRGQIARSIHMDAGQLRNATLTNNSGAVLASANFA
jgi:hypothetical protein